MTISGCLCEVEFARRSIREVALLRRLDHPHVLKLFGADSHCPEGAGRPDLYLCLELAEEDLRAVTRTRVLQPEEVRSVSCGILEARPPLAVG